MSIEGDIAERIKAAEMMREGVEYTEITFPKVVIRRIETGKGGIETTKQLKSGKVAEVVTMPPKLEEGMGENGGAIAKRQKEAIEKIPRRIRKEKMVLPELEEGMGKNGRAIVKHVEEAKNVELKRILYREIANHVAGCAKVPVIYYIVMIFGLASAIFGAVKVISPTIDFTIMLGGLGIFLAAFIGFLEIKLSKNEFREI